MVLETGQCLIDGNAAEYQQSMGFLAAANLFAAYALRTTQEIYAQYGTSPTTITAGTVNGVEIPIELGGGAVIVPPLWEQMPPTLPPGSTPPIDGPSWPPPSPM